MNMLNPKYFAVRLCTPYPKKLLSIFPRDAPDMGMQNGSKLEI